MIDVTLLTRQKAWSQKTFGPGTRLNGVLGHLEKELEEVRANPRDLEEWIDLMILAVDGAMRQGFTPTQVLETYAAKIRKNEAREWPDWREFSEDDPIEHVRTT